MAGRRRPRSLLSLTPAREVLSRREFSTMCVDAGRDYPRFIEVLLEGLHSTTNERTRTERRSHASRGQRAP
jgi:hypothetical protein